MQGWQSIILTLRRYHVQSEQLVLNLTVIQLRIYSAVSLASNFTP